jgi:hypothetical protein
MDSVLTYQLGNQWQRNRYAFMSKFNLNAGIREFGHAKKSETNYFHLLTENNELQNFLNEERIRKAVKKRFEKKAGDLPRVLTNTVASQPCCFNLFIPLQENLKLSSLLFSELLEKEVIVDEIIIEFTPETEGEHGDESLGDQENNRGTDADVAVFYNYGNSKGVILIEFKYIESEFSQCGSYKGKSKKDLRKVCDNNGFYETLILPNLGSESGRYKCGYLKYNNWELTKESKVFNNSAVVKNQGCPFKFSGQQIWRNLLLTENVAKSRKLDEFHFWVLSPVENSFLWKENGKDVEQAMRNVLTTFGNSIFRRMELDRDFFQFIKPLINDEWMKCWSIKFEERYLTGTKI